MTIYRIKTAIAIMAWILVVYYITYAAIAPNSWWIDSASIEVENGTVGAASPAVVLRTDYQKEILIHWHRMMVKSFDDDWRPICDIQGEGNVYTGEQTEHTTLDAIFQSISCTKTLAPGDYYLEFDLEWHDLIWRSVVVESNIFTISPSQYKRIPSTAPATPVVPSTRHYHLHNKPRIPWPFSLIFGGK